ncbi:MAG: UV DNA damage repair endonuclease UvsE [Deltaproteobacteria bacterium]|nr:UV DNA damage repair endonuclease UvsE [Deltaproteobacteria bacterium]
MKIGYPCVNRSIGCSGSRTFRLKNYSPERMIETTGNNLDCLLEMLKYNQQHNILFFRISSDLVPFASHPVCKFDWLGHFQRDFQEVGTFIRVHDMRISMHPDQFVVINSPDKGVVERSVAELRYHAQVLDLMQLDDSAKIQIHVGGVYRDKQGSIARFIDRYERLDSSIRKRLVIENDDISYTLNDCLIIHEATGIPVLFDSFHHLLNNSGEPLGEVIDLISSSWRKDDGIPMCDYSSQQEGERKGRHAETIDAYDFKEFLKASLKFDFDIMLEIKDKEKSALQAIRIASQDSRLILSP